MSFNSIWLLLALVLGLTASVLAQSVSVTSVITTTRVNNPLIIDFNVTLSSCSGLVVLYAKDSLNGSSQILQSPLRSAAENHLFPVMRLRPSSTYAYSLFATNSSSTLGSPIHTGNFSTGGLPAMVSMLSTELVNNTHLSFPLLLFANRQNPFAGVVVDTSDGSIVWILPGTLEVMKQRPNFNLVTIQNSAFSTIVNEWTADGTQTLEWWNRQFTSDSTLNGPVNSTFAVFDNNQPFCDNSLHHEVSSINDTIYYFLGRRNIAVPGLADLQEADYVLRWNRTNNSAQRIIDLAHFFSPFTHRINNSVTSTPSLWSGCNNDQNPTQTADWQHSNSVTVSAQDPSLILVSSRHLNQVSAFRIDDSAGGQSTLVWNLGGPGSNFTFADAPNGGPFYAQHSAWQLENGNVVLYDNGNARPAGEFTRAVEYSLDFGTMTATIVWQYRTDYFSFCCGNVLRMSNNNTLVHQGASPIGVHEVNEIDSSGNVAARLNIVLNGQNGTIIYRSQPLYSIYGEQVFNGTVTTVTTGDGLDSDPSTSNGAAAKNFAAASIAALVAAALFNLI